MLILGLVGCEQNAQKSLTFSAVFKDGTGGVDGLDDASSVAVSPDGKNVYVTGINALAVFNRDTSTGALNFSAVFKAGSGEVDGLNGAYPVAVSPDGKNVYVTSNWENTLSVFTRDTSTGALSYSTVIKDGASGIDGLNGASSVAVSPDNVYVAGELDDALAVFSRDTSTGSLSYSTVFKDGTGGVDGLDGASSVTVSPDNVYVTGWEDDALAVFTRDTGGLGYSTVFKDGINGVEGLDGAISVAVSPDNVYVVSELDDALAVFSRDTSTGSFSYSTVFKDGTGEVDGLDGATSVAVSPDGNNVYVTGWEDDALAVFTRDTSTEALAYSTVFKDGARGIDGLDGASSVAVSPDGKNVYVTGLNDNALVVFNRK